MSKLICRTFSVHLLWVWAAVCTLDFHEGNQRDLERLGDRVSRVSEALRGKLRLWVKNGGSELSSAKVLMLLLL